MLRPLKTKLLGVSLIEMLVVIALIGILSKMATSAYANLVFRMRIFSATSELHAGLLYARSESLKHGGNVIICRSVNAHAPRPACDLGKSDSKSNSGWGDGWLVFYDQNIDGQLSEADTILQVQGKLFSTPEQGAIIPSPNRKQIKFNSLGQVYGTFMQFSIGMPQTAHDVDHNRYICIAAGGRARVDKKLCNAK